MHKTYQSDTLFLVLLGGRAKKCNIELHDIRWVVGKSIKETIPELRNQWFGSIEGLHIDSYVAIKYIDTYEVILMNSRIPGDVEHKLKENKNYLWFINFGGYSDKSLIELHDFTLAVETSAKTAKEIAQKRLLLGAKKVHKDDITMIDSIINSGDISNHKENKSWTVYLSPDPLNRSQDLKADWYGYMKIDTF